jgi:hypothetical protein
MMITIARALIEQTAILELTDGSIDPDDTVKILESLASTLQSASPSEFALLRTALAEMLQEEISGSRRPPFLKFYREFMYNLGIDESPP